MGASGHNLPPLQAGLDAKASGGNTHQALDVFAIAVGLLLNEVGQLDGVFGTGGQCTAHGVQVAAEDAVIRSKAGCLKARVLQQGLGWANQIGMLLGVVDAAQLAPYPDWKIIFSQLDLPREWAEKVSTFCQSWSLFSPHNAPFCGT